jgi:hypothetical protein
LEKTIWRPLKANKSHNKKLKEQNMKFNKQKRLKSQLLFKLKHLQSLLSWLERPQSIIHVQFLFIFSIFGCQKNLIFIKNCQSFKLDKKSRHFVKLSSQHVVAKGEKFR